MIENDISWMVGGAQGSGVDSAATIFARGCNYAGLYVYGQREYYSNIMGEHSYFIVRVNSNPIRSHFNQINLLTTFDAETIARHFLTIADTGGLIYDPNTTNIKLSDIATFEKRLLSDTETYLKNQGLNDTLDDILKDCSNRGIKLYPVDYSKLIKEVANKFPDTKLSNLTKMTNLMAVSCSFSLLNFDLEKLFLAIEHTFKNKDKIIEMNKIAAQYSYDYMNTSYQNSFNYNIKNIDVEEKRIFLQGSQAIALGKLTGGCRFQTYYPISPATDESVYLSGHDTFKIENDSTQNNDNDDLQRSMLVVQTEDEISAITMAAGAAVAGTRSSTSTSGPGFSLMTEGIGWTGMNEVPIVITLYQRGGPSTGLPTRHEQGDLKFALNAGHGEFPKIVIASGDIEECFYDSIQAFNYAEKFQLPVIHIVDKALASTTLTTPIFNTQNIEIDRGKLITPETSEQITDKYSRFKFTSDGISPRTILGTPNGLFWLTGDEHDENGNITEDPITRMRIMEKRMKKLELANKQIIVKDKVSIYGPKDANITIVSWGSTKGVILDVIDKLNSYDNKKVNFIQIKLLSPFPEQIVQDLLSNSSKKISVEMNYTSQLASVVKEHTGITMDHFITKYNGRPMKFDELYNSIKKLILENTPNKIVLTHGS